MQSGFSLRRRALTGCFLAAGTGIGTWGANLPALGRRADISEAGIGIVLLCFAAGAILAMVNAPRLIRRFGAGRSAAVAAAVFGLAIMAVSLVHAMLTAGIVAVFGGMAFGTLDVTMNKEVAALEARAGRPIMSSFHAVFSLGTLLSAVCYAGLVKAGADVSVCLLVAGGMIAAIALASVAGLPVERGAAAAGGAQRGGSGQGGVPLLQVLVLGTMAFLAFFAEGAILDWIAVYMVRVLGAGESMGAICYAVFAGAMTAGRLCGDRVTRMLGPVRLFTLGTLSVAAGFALALSTAQVAVIFAALAVCGLGVANIIPVIFSAAGRLGDADGGRTMSRVLTMGYAGILIGPALIGFVAELATLRAALFLVVAAMILIAFTASHLRRA